MGNSDGPILGRDQRDALMAGGLLLLAYELEQNHSHCGTECSDVVKGIMRQVMDESEHIRQVVAKRLAS